MFVDESAAAAAHQFATFGIILVVVVLVLFFFFFSPFFLFQMFFGRLVDYDARPSQVPLHKHERMAMTTYLYYLLFYFFKNAEIFKLKIIICEGKY